MTDRADPAQRLVVCLGDSITRARVSADYVADLGRRWRGRGVRFENAGIDGQLAYNLNQRLDPVIAAAPDAVTVLVGTNDINALLNDAMSARYVRDQHLPTTPTLEWSAGQLDALLGRLARETNAALAVLEIPPLGERLDSRVNGLVREYNAALRDAASRHGVRVLPLYDRLTALLPSGATPPPYTGDLRLVVQAMARHTILRQSWDRIAARHGFTLLTDHIHLGETGARVIADLVDGFVGDVVTAGRPA